MIISRTPFRISFVGGGTDLRAFYQKEFGQVLSTSINKYIYVAVKKQTEIVDFKYRINWSKVEFKNNIDDIVNKRILPLVDHKLLNDIDTLDNPTSEHLVKWIWNILINEFSGLEKLKLSEDHGTGITYKGE